MSTVLIGYRGSGKTTIGKRLADRLWQEFVDVDQVIVEKAGRSIREIFESEGEARFRDLESQVVAEVASRTETVVALGGGSLIREANRQAIRDAGATVIYLRCEPRELLRRIEADTSTAESRPNLTSLGGGLDEITTLLAEREPTYREMASAELDVTNLSPEEAVVRVTQLM